LRWQSEHDLAEAAAGHQRHEVTAGTNLRAILHCAAKRRQLQFVTAGLFAQVRRWCVEQAAAAFMMGLWNTIKMPQPLPGCKH
jgi:hypothetical protein